MITLDLSKLTPSDIELLLKLAHDNPEAITPHDIERLMNVYVALCGRDELDVFLLKLNK